MSAVVTSGDLKADGTVKLDVKPALRPGRVRITLEALSETQSPPARLPVRPWLDEGAPAPLDLPHFGAAMRVQPRAAAERLLEPLDLVTEDEA
jgi:hypothetical protein